MPTYLSYKCTQNLRLVRERGANPYLVKGADCLFTFFRPIANEPQETMHAAVLDAKNRIIATDEVSMGTLNGTVIHPREVFRLAILKGAVSIVLVHNHPSGDPSPSQEDTAATNRIRQAGELLGIRLLDHIIVGNGEFYSFHREGFLS